MHGNLNQETVFGIFLKLKPVKQSLSLLQQAQRSFKLLVGDEMNRTVIELMQDNWHFILIKI